MPSKKQNPEYRTVIRIGREEYPADNDLGKMVLEAYGIKGEKDEDVRRLEEANSRILEHVQHMFADMDTGTVNILCEDTVCKITLKDSVKVSEPDTLMAFLGEDRFADLVDIKTEYRPSKRLLEMALDGDNPNREEIRKCLTIKPAKPAVSYTRK